MRFLRPVDQPQGQRSLMTVLLLSGCLNLLLVLIVFGRLPSPDGGTGDGAAAAITWGPPPDVCGRTTLDESHQACSEHGILFDGADDCVCFDCWTGSRCEHRVHGSACVINADGGTPYIFEDYWVAHPEAQITIRPSYHIGYSFGTLPRLERAIRELHSMTGNALTRGRYLVVGIGSTELVNAAIYALASSAVGTA